jgi:energy-coupling factor transport system permease protein
MRQGFSLYQARPSGLHRLHPFTKLSLTATILIAAFAIPGPWAGYAFFLLGLLPLAAWGQVLTPFLRAVLRAVLPFAFSLFLIQGLLWPGGTPWLQFGPLSLKLEGLAFAVASTARILLIVSGFMILALSTRPDMLMTALSQRGVPSSLSYLIVTTLQIVPHFQARARAILDAQRSRALETEGGLRRRAQALLPLIVPLVLSSILDIEERAIALEARAFGRRGPKTSLLQLTDTPAQAILRRILLALAPLLLIARLAL